MKFFWLALHVLLVGCSSLPQPNPAPAEEKEKTPSVSVEAALEHIRHSYTLGCVEAMRSQGKRLVYPECRDKGRKHSETVRQILDQPISDKLEEQE